MDAGWNKGERDNDLLLLHLYERYVQQLYNYGMHACNNREWVRNILQELFVHVRNQGELLLTDRTVRFCLFKRFRDLLTRRCMASSESSRMFMTTTDTASGNVGLQTPDEFSTLQREAVLLKSYGDFSYQEVAAIMDIDLKLARKLVTEAGA